MEWRNILARGSAPGTGPSIYAAAPTGRNIYSLRLGFLRLWLSCPDGAYKKIGNLLPRVREEVPDAFFGGAFLIGDDGGQFLGLGNHTFYLGEVGDAVDEVLHGIDFVELCLEVGGHAVLEFLDGVHAGGFEEFCKLTGYAIDAHKVGVVGPLEDELVDDACGLCEFLAAFGGGTLGEDVVGGLHAYGVELLCIDFAYAFNLFYFVSHFFDIKGLGDMVEIGPEP